VSGGWLVHGLGEDLVDADWPPITLSQVKPVLSAFGLPAVAVTWHSARPLSAAALVAAGDRTVFVKRHSTEVRSVAGLVEEHAFATHLRRRGIPVPEPLRTSRGGTVVRRDGWTWEVHERGTGNDLYRETLSWQPFYSATHAHSAGVMLARLATAGEDFTAPARVPQPLVTSAAAICNPDLLEGLAHYVAERPMVRAALEGRDWQGDVVRDLLPLHLRFAPYAEELPHGWTHGDGHASNFLWGPAGEVSAVLDLGLSDRTTPILDLATAIERNAVSWLSPEPAARLDVVDALLRGWCSVRELSEVEAVALPELLAVVHVEFALSELGYFHGVTHSAANAQVAYEDYLLGHARWHAGPEGKALRRHLQSVLGRLSSGLPGPVRA
jgi:Ser/Thr protein kinase RdoA (MazF antagonist)